MKTIKLKNGAQIPIIGFGTYELAGSNGIRAVELALEFGYKHIDTAESYHNQQEVAEAVANSALTRNDLFITSKVQYENLHYDDLIRACENTLKDLNTDYLDLYLIHWPNKNIPLEETMDALSKLKKEGKIKNIGVSNFTIKHLEEAKNISDEIVVNQVEYHPYLNQKDLYEYCKENNIYITAYSPIARGNVFGDPVLTKIADRYNKNEVQITLRWMIQKDIIVIPRSSKAEHIKANFDVFDWKLDSKDMEQIDNIEKKMRLINPEWGEFNL